MYIFGSNGHRNVGTVDTPMDTEYESGDSQATIDNVTLNIVMKTLIFRLFPARFSVTAKTLTFILFPERLPVIARTLPIHPSLDEEAAYPFRRSSLIHTHPFLLKLLHHSQTVCVPGPFCGQRKVWLHDTRAEELQKFNNQICQPFSLLFFSKTQVKLIYLYQIFREFMVLSSKNQVLNSTLPPLL